ncbi:MAG: cell division protein FtsZ [Synergistaceae bacterium]|nr:cell division protein FtsZ [Synergistaceae bacterium]
MEQSQVFHIPEPLQQREQILVIGVGGGGGNALNHIIESGVEGVEFVAANTDATALAQSKAPYKIALGEKLTRGRGAGGNPQVGTDAAKESIDRIREYLEGCEMVFVTAGMGGGTGTGAAPIIAEIAKEMQILVVGVVTTPFGFELNKRAQVAQDGIAKLREKVDALLVVENDRLLAVANEKTTTTEAFKMANEVLRQAVQGVTDLVLKPGLINVDFADVKTIMRKAGSAIMGIGVGEGENRAEVAAKAAIKSPLMSMPLKGAKGVLINIEGTSDLGIFEMKRAAEIITENADPDVEVIWGHTVNENAGNTMRVTVIATGFSATEQRQPPQAVGEREMPKRIGGFSLVNPRTPEKVVSSSGNFSLDETDLQPSLDEDMFSGMPKTAYDTPSILRVRNRPRR